MKKTPNKVSAKHSVRFTDDDRRIISKLREKLGVDVAGIVRMSIRKFAEFQGISK